MPANGRYQHMDVIVHDDEVFKPVLRYAIMSHHVLNDLPDLWPRQETFSMSFIQPCLPAVRKQTAIFFFVAQAPRLRMRFEPCVRFFHPLIDPLAWHGVCR